MKKLFAMLTVIALLTAICAGCTPTNNTSGNNEVNTPETTVGTPVDDTSAPTGQTTEDPTQAPTETTTQATTKPTTGVKVPEVNNPGEEEGNNVEIDFDDLLGNS